MNEAGRGAAAACRFTVAPGLPGRARRYRRLRTRLRQLCLRRLRDIATTDASIKIKVA